MNLEVCVANTCNLKFITLKKAAETTAFKFIDCKPVSRILCSAWRRTVIIYLVVTLL